MVGLFKKKKQQEKKIEMPSEVDMPFSDVPKQENKSKNKHKNMSNQQQGGYGYDVELYDVWDTTSRRLPAFGANRIIEGDNVYLYNDKTGFKVPFPENSEDYKQYTLDELDLQIKGIENKIKKVKGGKLDWSLKDLNKELRVLKNYARSLQLQGRGSYMIINANGRPLFMFDRINNFKMPLFKNTDRSLIYTPTEQKTQEVTQLLKENHDKNGQEQTIKLTTYGLILLLLLGVCFMFFMGYKMMNLPGEITQSLADVAVSLADVSKDLNNVSVNINNIAQSSIDPNAIVTAKEQIVTGR